MGVGVHVRIGSMSSLLWREREIYFKFYFLVNTFFTDNCHSKKHPMSMF